MFGLGLIQEEEQARPRARQQPRQSEAQRRSEAERLPEANRLPEAERLPQRAPSPEALLADPVAAAARVATSAAQQPPVVGCSAEPRIDGHPSVHSGGSEPGTRSRYRRRTGE